MDPTDGIPRAHGDGSSPVTSPLTGAGGKYSLAEFVMAAPPASGSPIHVQVRATKRRTSRIAASSNSVWEIKSYGGAPTM